MSISQALYDNTEAATAAIRKALVHAISHDLEEGAPLGVDITDAREVADGAFEIDLDASGAESAPLYFDEYDVSDILSSEDVLHNATDVILEFLREGHFTFDPAPDLAVASPGPSV